METHKISTCLALLATLFLAACGPKTAKTKSVHVASEEKAAVVIPQFNADSAYHYVDKQVSFGPRVPNTEAHKLCGNYLVSELERFGAKVYTQETVLQGFEHKWEAKNIIGEFSPEKNDRILLCAHWDSRYTSDRETEKENQLKPVTGANDGASGVGVLLEIARQLQKQSPEVGVDLILFDVEDQGTPSYKTNNSDDIFWCLGSQYWSKTPHKPGYSARYGILLDMVGAPGAVFRREMYSMQFAPNVVNKVWREAIENGFSTNFSLEQGGGILDDHYFVNTVANIPTIDIIHYDYTTPSRFGEYWHTNHDNMDHVDKTTLHAVGQTLLNVLYKEPF